MSPNWKKLVVSGSDATLNSLNVLTSVTASNFTGSFSGDGSNLTNVPVDIEAISTYNSTFTSATTVSVTHSLNTTNPLIQVYDGSNEQVIPQTVRIVDNNKVEIVFPTSTTGKVVIAKGGHIITTSDLSFVAQSFTSQSSITVSHDFNTTAPIVQVYDNSGEQVIPQSVQVIDADTVQVTFPTTISGQVAVSKGGPVLTGTNISGSFSGSFNSLGHFLPSEDEQFDLGSPDKKWRSLYLSGSTIYLGTLQLKDEGGSLSVKAQNGDPISQTISGSLTTDQLILNAGNSFNIITSASVTRGVFDETALIDPTISPDQYSGANIEYVIQRPGASRSGTIMTSWSGSSISYTDFSATGVGDTSDLTFDVVMANNKIRLRAYSAGSGSGDWNLHTLFKLFPHIT